MKKTRGLILGKLAPFHIGHKRLIETALKEVDEVYVLIYDCPNLINIPLNIRANWVRYFFPQVHVIEGWDAPNRHENTDEVKRLQENYVKKVLNGNKITHFFSSEYYGEHMSKSLNAVDRRLDRNDPKQGYITTATMIRNGKNMNKNFLSKIVYKDLLIKVVFIGIPSDEQSKLVKNIAKKFRTTYVGDNLLKISKEKLSKNKVNFYKIADEKYKIANTDSKIFSAKEYLFYNSTGFVDSLLSIATHNKFSQESYNFFSDDLKNYDIIFVNNISKNNIGDTIGLDGGVFLNQIIKSLNSLKINYQVLSGTFEEKLLIIEKIVKTFTKRFNQK